MSARFGSGILLAAAIWLLAAAPAVAQDKRTIGKLGQAIAATTIHSAPTGNARVYSKVRQYQYLVINQSKNAEWFTVVLANGQNGYIRAEKVASLPYNVTVPVKAAVRTTTASRSGSPGRPTVSASNPAVQNMLDYSFNYIGTPYRWGGNDLERGIDCSGFVKQLFGKIGVSLPRTAAEQALVGARVERLEDLQPGDRLYFWDSKRRKIGHTGIFLGFFQDGGAYFIHSSSGRRGVQTDDLRAGKWRNILVAARR